MTAPTTSLKGLDLLAEIARLKKERNAVILAHYYQKPEIQDLADFVGDSLDLSRKAAATDADVIAFCGVRFMAETAKILSPEKIVDPARHGRRLQPRGQLPARPVHGVPRGASRPYRADLHQLLGGGEGAQRHHRHRSSSADIILNQIPKDQKIIFGPDRHLGGYLARRTGRDMLLWPGICIVHQAFSETELLKLKAQHPGAPVAAHPECPPHIIDHADHVGSTKAILDFALSIARPRRSSSRPSRTSSTRWRKPRRTRPSSARPAATAIATATCARTWRSTRSRSSTSRCAT